MIRRVRLGVSAAHALFATVAAALMLVLPASADLWSEIGRAHV